MSLRRCLRLCCALPVSLFVGCVLRGVCYVCVRACVRCVRCVLCVVFVVVFLFFALRV